MPLSRCTESRTTDMAVVPWSTALISGVSRLDHFRSPPGSFVASQDELERQQGHERIEVVAGRTRVGAART